MNQKLGLALSFTGATHLLGLTQLLRLCTNQGLPLSERPQSPNLCLTLIPPASLARLLHIPTPSQAFRSSAGLPAFARLQLVSVFPGDPRPSRSSRAPAELCRYPHTCSQRLDGALPLCSSRALTRRIQFYLHVPNVHSSLKHAPPSGPSSRDCSQPRLCRPHLPAPTTPPS